MERTMENRIKSHHIKKLDDVLGGPSEWKNDQLTEMICPRCSNEKAYFMQMRSADEPMTTFYRCSATKCAHMWKE